MTCKKHLTDLSSTIGVCASCLRERLFALIVAQTEAQALVLAPAPAPQAQEDHRKSDFHPPPLIFPRSVSPYICRRKSDNSEWNRDHRTLSDQRFYSTPQVGPSGGIATASLYKKKHSKFFLLSNLFRSKPEETDLDRMASVSNSRDSCTASSSSPSWFSSIFPGRRKKQSRLFSLDESTAGTRRPCRNRDAGMSPARYMDDAEECYDGMSGYSSESPQGWKQTPSRAATQIRRAGRSSQARNVSGLAFCLSPLVRANTHRHWSQKGMPPDMALSGEIKAPVKHHLSTAASLGGNRSRKFADFGRFNHNH